MTKIKLGIAGFGHRGKNMLGICAAGFDFVEITAICELLPELLKSAEEKYPAAKLFTDYNEMLDTAGLDAVLVETPADNHAVFCARALRKNIHVFSDIPSVNSIEEAEMLWRTAQDSNALFMTGANPNFWGFIEAAVDLERQGLLGAPSYMEAEYIHDCQELFDQTPWRRTFPPIKYCTHSLGPLLRLIDEDLKYVSCFTTGSHINNYPDQQDVMTAHFRTASNVVVRFTASFVNNAVTGHHYRVFGTEGYFERFPGIPGLEEPKVIFRSNKLYGAGKPTELKIGYMRPEYENNPKAVGHGGADFAMFDSFFKAIINKNDSPIPLREGLRMTLPGLYACVSAERGGEIIEIKYPWENQQ